MKGFTLAEVLITLGIIGVVAAMTLPSLIQNQKKIETAARLKKFYSTMHQAILLSKANNAWEGQKNPTDTRYDNELLSKWFDTTLAQYMQIGKNCGIDANKKCVGYLDNTNFVKIVLADGSSFIMNNNGIIHLLFDTNGTKKPNERGRDIFVFFLDTVKGDFHPSNYTCEFLPEEPGCIDTYAVTREDLIQSCGRSSESHTSDTNTCGALIMQDGWEIKDDYPIRL